MSEIPQEKVTLSRTLSLFTITMIGVGGMIGAGIFVLTGIAAGVAGPGLILAFLLNGIVTTFTALSYAELGSGFPEAGGGYLWVKEGLGGTNGYLAGWMSWFAHAAAGSLYALGFGTFATELWRMAGLPLFGLSESSMALVWMTIIIVIFTTINYRGASETGTIGNIVTMTKIVILGVFVIFGILAMLRTEAWVTRFTTGFLPNGFFAVFVAMGLTFIAFEGYEIIAQSGEEAINPKRNIPRAIFLSIGIAVDHLYSSRHHRHRSHGRPSWDESISVSWPAARTCNCRCRATNLSMGSWWRCFAHIRSGFHYVSFERDYLFILPCFVRHGT